MAERAYNSLRRLRPMPERLFGYEILAELGSGAGSHVYAACAPSSNQLVALKHVVCRRDKDQRLIALLANELEIGQRIQHPVVRRSIEMQSTKTWLGKVTEAVLALELFDGVSLDVQPPLTMLEAVDCFLAVAQGLSAMHHAGYVHCDLKPNNILLNAAGQVKIIDLGQACKVGTAKQRIQGTPDYIAPEQVRKQPVSVRTDIYNLGATLYWVLCGKNLTTLYTLRREENSFLVDQAIPSPHAICPEVPENLSSLVAQCIRTNPEKRPADMGEVIHRLDAVRFMLAQHPQLLPRMMRDRIPAAEGSRA